MSITRDEYRRARYIADAGSDLLMSALRTSPRGRPSRHLRILLTGLLLTIDTRGMATVTKVHDVLTKELDIEDQWDLGVRTRTKAGAMRILTLPDLYNMTRRISKMLDHTTARAGHLTDTERYDRREHLDRITQAIIDATLIPRPEGSEDFAVDGTGIWSAEKGLPGASRIPTDPDTHEEDTAPENRDSEDSDETIAAENTRPKPGSSRRLHSDAAWGRKTAKVGGREVYFGFDAEVLVRVPTKGKPKSEPPLAESLVLLPASTDIVTPVLSMLDRLKGDGRPIRSLLTDRHYSFKKYDRWLAGLLERRIRQVVDLHPADQGFRDWDGMKIAAGWAHCPFTPEDLGTMPTLAPSATAEEREDFEARIAERQAYAAQRVDRLDTAGKIRFRCPALNGTLGCSRRPGTEAVAIESGQPIVRPGADDVYPKMCTQNTVQLTVDTRARAKAMKVHQDQYWGSPAWRLDYSRRTFVEGFFGVLKNPSATGHRRGSHQFTGLPLVSLVLACSAAITNTRLLRAWHDETGVGPSDHELLAPDQEFHGFRQLTREEAESLDSTFLDEPKAS